MIRLHLPNQTIWLKTSRPNEVPNSKAGQQGYYFKEYAINIIFGICQSKSISDVESLLSIGNIRVYDLVFVNRLRPIFIWQPYNLRADLNAQGLDTSLLAAVSLWQN
jgi:hypothetical protein